MSIPETTPRPRCVHCGASYGYRLQTREAIVTAEGESYTFPPTSRVVIGERSLGWGWQRTQHERDTWDGQTWAGGKPPFCTLRCAHDFACKAYLAGFRA